MVPASPSHWRLRMALATTPAAPTAPTLLPSRYTIMLRVPGIEGWQFGMFVSSAFAALEAQNYIRRNHFGTDVKVLGR